VHRSGRINFIGLLMLVGVVGAAWWAVTFVPIYFDHFEVKSQVEAVVLYEGVVAGSEKLMVDDLRRRLSRIGTHFEVNDETGEEQEIPGILVDEDNAEAEVTATEIRMRFKYARKSVWKFTKKPVQVEFDIEKSRALKK
jgi:hypothetical protein